MTFKEVVKDHWVNMDNVVSVVVDHQGELRIKDNEGWLYYEVAELKDTPEHWRNWLRERS